MKRFAIVFSVVSLLLVSLSAVSQAAQPLAYRDGFSVGALYEHAQFDTNVALLKGSTYGAIGSYMNNKYGLAAHVSVVGSSLKGDAEYLMGSSDKDVTTGSPLVSIEVSKRLHQFEDGIQVGVYAKYTRLLGTAKASDDYSYEDYDYNGNVIYSTTYRDEATIRNLQQTEVGLLFQKDFSMVHLYGGPKLKLIRGDVDYKYSERGYESWTYSEKLKEKSSFAVDAGVTVDLTKNIAINVHGAFNGAQTYGGQLELRF